MTPFPTPKLVAPRTRASSAFPRRKQITSFIFLLFLATVFVRTVPFTARKTFELGSAAEGDAGRQVILILFFLVIAMPVIWRRPERLLYVAGYPFLIFLAYCLITLAWSPVPDIGARRLGLTIVISACLIAGVTLLPARDVLVSLRRVLIGLTFVSLLAGLLLPTLAIHQPGDPERAIVGAWRGLFYHKNLAGIAAGLAVLLSIDMAVMRRRPYDGCAALLLCGLTLWLTDSVTSIAATAFASLYFFATLVFLRWQRNSGHDRLIFQIALACAVAFALGLVWLSFDWVSYFASPEAFTGRGRIWVTVLELIHDRPLRGYGYESVFQVGTTSPLSSVTSNFWLRTVAHSHNGWLDILVTIGLIGAALYIFCFIVQPVRHLLGLPQDLKLGWFPLLTSWIVFGLAHSLLEGKMLTGDGQIFMISVLVMALARRIHGAQHAVEAK